MSERNGYGSWKRKSGRTSDQMRSAPIGAVFIWCTNHTHYPLALARHVGRTDLRIMPIRVLNSKALNGVALTGIILDHAAVAGLSAQQYLTLVILQGAIDVRTISTSGTDPDLD